MLLEPLQVKTPVRYPVSLFLKHDAVDAMNLFGFRKRLNELIKTKQSEEKKKQTHLQTVEGLEKNRKDNCICLPSLNCHL